ncbi:MAG: hypothetical protein AAB675_04705 [Patescibacteria group bacterium]
MTATGHAIIGTVIAVKVGNPALAIPLALVSHLAADAFPHWDEGTNSKLKTKNRLFGEAFFDVIFGFTISYLLVFFLFPQINILYVFLVVVFAQLPDWITAPYYFFGIQEFKIFHTLQKKFDNRLDAPWGIINQVAILGLIVALAMIF